MQPECPNCNSKNYVTDVSIVDNHKGEVIQHGGFCKDCEAFQPSGAME